MVATVVRMGSPLQLTSTLAMSTIAVMKSVRVVTIQQILDAGLASRSNT